MCGVVCGVCEEIISSLDEPCWFCRISRQLGLDPRVVRRHLTSLVETGRVQVRNLGTMKLYEKTSKTKKSS